MRRFKFIRFYEILLFRLFRKVLYSGSQKSEYFHDKDKQYDFLCLFFVIKIVILSTCEVLAGKHQ